MLSVIADALFTASRTTPTEGWNEDRPERQSRPRRRPETREDVFARRWGKVSGLMGG